MTTTVTITARQFAQLVRGVLPHVSKDRTLPLLNSVFLETSGNYLMATATDRYTLATGRVHLDEAPPAGFTVAVSADDVRRITTWFKGTRTLDPTLTLTLDGYRLTVASAGLMDLLEAHLTLQVVDRADGKFLGGLKRILREAVTGEPMATVQCLNPSMVAKFAHAQAGGLPMVAWGRDPNKPWVFKVGNDFLGLVMPVRRYDDVAPQTHIDEAWSTALAATADATDNREEAA